TAVPAGVGAAGNGSRARPRHRAAPKAARAPWTMIPTPTRRVKAAGCHPSSNPYRSWAFDRMAPAGSTRTIPRQTSKARLIAPSFRCRAASPEHVVRTGLGGRPQTVPEHPVQEERRRHTRPVRELVAEVAGGIDQPGPVGAEDGRAVVPLDLRPGPLPAELLADHLAPQAGQGDHHCIVFVVAERLGGLPAGGHPLEDLPMDLLPPHPVPAHPHNP